MKIRILRLIFFSWIIIAITMSSWYVLNGDINFSSDISRDFLLFSEIDKKGIMLLGARSSVSGLFHGPLWLYINYPAYKISGGNPVVVGWYWIFLTILFLIGSFVIAKKLFDKNTAYLFVLFNSVYLIFHAHSYINPHGIFFTLPFFYYFLYRYITRYKIKDLIYVVFLGGILIQFQIAIGAPYVLLSFAYIVYIQIVKKKIKHIFALFLITVPLSTYIVFDLRHNYAFFHAMIRFLSSYSIEETISFREILFNRIRMLFLGHEIIRSGQVLRNMYLLVFGIFLLLQMKNKKIRRKYTLFLYLYVGYFVVSLINVGPLLYFYLYPQFSLLFLIFSSIVTSRYKFIAQGIVISAIVINTMIAVGDIRVSNMFIGKDLDSWKFHKMLARNVYENARSNDFGYFIYSPDIFGYQQKYAMWYIGKSEGFQSVRSVKRPETFLIMAPPPPGNPYWESKWWKENQVRISNKPVETYKYENGYVVERYLLSAEDISEPFDKSIDPGIHFR